MLIGAIVLLAGHIALSFVWPVVVQSPTGSAPVRLRLQINLALYVANLFALACVLLTRRPLNTRRVIGYVFGYAAVVWLLWPLMRIMPENVLLLVLAVFVYGALLGHPRLLGYLYLFLLAQRFVPAYLYPTFVLTSLFYTTLPPFARTWRQHREGFVSLCYLTGLILLLVLLLPIIYFCTQSSAQDIEARLREADVLSALAVSLKTSAAATLFILLLGVPLAYAMVRRSFPARGLIDTLIDLPIVVPPPIAGIALMSFLGPRSALGQYLDTHLGVRFFDTEWGIVAAQVFVGSPYLIRASMVAFSAVDVRYENVARTLGASSMSAFLRVSLPMSIRGILIGVILSWFRAMAEFGSLRILANRPRTIPILAYERFIEYRQSESQSVGVLVLLLCLCVIVGMWVIRSMPTLLGKAIGASDASR
jgi:molybdate/tungstate transport system permease protein